MRKITLIIVLVILYSSPSFSQSFAINTSGTPADASAMLDVASTTKGMLIPRMSTAEKTAIASPATGLIIYDTDLNQFYFWNGTVWTAIPTGASANNYWTLSGSNKLYNNTGTNVGIGLTNPLGTLDIAGTSAGTNSLLLRSGNNSGGNTSSQIAFSYNNSNNHKHSIRTRHNSGNSTMNAIDFYLWQVSDAPSAMGTKHVMTLEGTGFVGIGITTPICMLHVADGNVTVTGAVGSGPTIEAAGAGARMLFSPRKAAFRAGAVSSTQWDDANVGSYSVAMGQNAQAISDYSIAIGEGNIAETGSFAVAIGRENHSTGFASLAMGHFSEASGSYATSIGLRDTVSGFGASSLGGYNKVSGAYGLAAGLSNVASGNDAVAFGTLDTAAASNTFVTGYQNKVSANESAAFGSNNKVSSTQAAAFGSSNSVSGIRAFASGNSNIVSNTSSFAAGESNTVSSAMSMAFGFQNTVGGFVTFAAGRSNTTAGNHSIAFGYSNNSATDQAFTSGMQNTVNGKNGAAFGVSNTVQAYGEFTIGHYATNYTAVNANDVDPADRVFTVGNGTSVTRSNALEIWNNGWIGVNNAVPNSNLTVKGSVAYSVTTTTGSLTLNDTHYCVIYTGGSGNTFTLGAATGRVYYIVNHGTGVLNITTYYTGNVATSTTVAVAATVELIYDGTNWRKIN
jgi:hypothetical protein